MSVGNETAAGVEAVKVTSVREAIKAVGAGRVKGANAVQVDLCERVGRLMDRRPLLGAGVQMILLSRYHKDHPEDTGEVDWTNFLDWLVTNMPKIIEVIMSILGMFGL